MGFLLEFLINAEANCYKINRVFKSSCKYLDDLSIVDSQMMKMQLILDYISFHIYMYCCQARFHF